VKRLKIGSFRQEACAGALAPPGGTRAPRAFSAVDSGPQRARIAPFDFFTASGPGTLERLDSCEKRAPVALVGESVLVRYWNAAAGVPYRSRQVLDCFLAVAAKHGSGFGSVSGIIQM